MLKLGVLVSGGGTNLQAILDAVDQGTITNAQVGLVISNNAGAYALERAKKHGIDFLAASDVAEPSSRDREHMDEESHRRFAEAVYERLAG